MILSDISIGTIINETRSDKAYNEEFTNIKLPKWILDYFAVLLLLKGFSVKLISGICKSSKED